MLFLVALLVTPLVSVVPFEAASPLIGAAAFQRRGMRRAAAASALVGTVSAACLLGTLLVEGAGGLQRAGLTVVDAWYVVTAAWVLRRR